MTLDLDRVAAALPAYEIGSEVGRGGWGLVLSGRHRALGRTVAIKELPRAFAADPAVRVRFAAEARLLASLDHPHIVPVHDYVEADGLCLLVMEYLPGGTVWSRFTESGLTMDAAAGVTMATCAALDWAHARGILHRDVKPENLMFSGAGVLKVTDFGLAKVLGGPETLATRAGEVLGTPAYMAPEQAQGLQLSPATDVYAAGTMLYELLSGRLPFAEGGDALTLLYRHVYERPLPLFEVAPQVPEGVANVVMRALSPDPADRWPSAEGFGIALAEACTTAWGTGWLGRGSVRVMAAESMLAVTERPSGQVVSPLEGPSAAGVEGPRANGPDPPRGAPDTEMVSPRPAPPTEHVSALVPVVVRPTMTVHAAVVVLERDHPSELVPVGQVLVRRPARPGRKLLAAGALLAVALGLAFLGPGQPGSSGTIPRGRVEVDGVDIASGRTVSLDLAKPVTVTGSEAGVAHAALTLSVLGIPLGTSQGAPTRAGPSVPPYRSSIDERGARYLAVGVVTGTLRVGKRSATFPVAPAQSAWLSVPGAVGIALVLFVAAYAESLGRSLRRGRKRLAGTAGMTAVGVLSGLAAVWLAWLAGSSQPTVVSVVLCLVLGGGAGFLAARAAVDSSRARSTRGSRRG